MKAITYEKYGPPEVLQLTEVAKPEPKADEVLLKVHAATVNMGDCELRSPKIPNSIWLMVRLFFGPLKPRKKILGAYLAGEVEATGSAVRKFKTGDPIFACTGPRFGAYAEYICISEKVAIAAKPENLSYEEASALPLGLDALHFLELAQIKKGERVLVNGAGGGIGTIAVQLAKHYGAEVTAVDSAAKLEMLRSIGADHLVDYQQQDFSKTGETYDVIFDLVLKGSYSRCVRSLVPNGRYILANPDGFSQLLRGLWTSMVRGKRVISKFASAEAQNLLKLKDLIEAGKLKPVVDKTYSLEEVVKAHTYVETGQKKGNVVLLIN